MVMMMETHLQIFCGGSTVEEMKRKGDLKEENTACLAIIVTEIIVLSYICNVFE